jgi:hypothetical protein
MLVVGTHVFIEKVLSSNLGLDRWKTLIKNLFVKHIDYIESCCVVLHVGHKKGAKKQAWKYWT